MWKIKKIMRRHSVFINVIIFFAPAIQIALQRHLIV